MPVVKVYHHGVTAGVPPTKNDHMRAKRGNVGGWSYSSIRSNTRFLYSVEEQHLTGVGVALTLTVRDCPDSHEDWHRTRRAFVERLRRMGMIRMHWVTEWQRRGVPHLHCAVWFETRDHVADALLHWIDVAGRYGASLRGQHAAWITDAVGWFQYLSKHASRGLNHYQRSPEGIPKGWRKTGRMWGYLGEWPRRPPMALKLTTEGFYVFRRLVRGYRVADARRAIRDADTPQKARIARRRLSQARRMLQDSDRSLASVRGVSEWIEVDDQLKMVAVVASLGYPVEHQTEAGD